MHVLAAIGGGLQFFGVLVTLKTLLHVRSEYGRLPRTRLVRVIFSWGRWGCRHVRRLLGIHRDATVVPLAGSASARASMTGSLTVGPGRVDCALPVEDQVQQLQEALHRLADELRAELRAERDALRNELDVTRTEARDRHAELSAEVRKLATYGLRSRWWGVAMILTGTILLTIAGAYP